MRMIWRRDCKGLGSARMTRVSRGWWICVCRQLKSGKHKLMTWSRVSVVCEELSLLEKPGYSVHDAFFHKSYVP